MSALLLKIRCWLERLDVVVIHGAGRDILKPKKDGGVVKYFLNWLDYVVFSFLDRLDARIIFKGRSVRTEKGRVRSRAERKIVLFFERHKIQYDYEPKLVLDGVKLHPDFYLPQHGVYVEFWGMVNESRRYRKIMRLKMYLYKKHRIPIVSLFPRHIGSLEKVFPMLCEKAMGQN